MGMVVRTNMAAINANNALGQASKAQQNGMQKLASGFKINKAADDASGLAISEKMKNQIKALDTAKDNCEDGANLIQTAEGYMAETHEILNRMTELAEKAANGVLENEDRESLQKEMDELCGEIDRIATTANFNGHKLLDGSIGSTANVSYKSVEGKGITYTSPASATEKVMFGGGKVNGNAGGLIDEATYKLAAAGDDTTATNTFDKATVSLTLLDGEGAATATTHTVTIEALDGDTVTIDKNGSGTSANGLKFSNVEDVKGGTFKFNKAEGKWQNVNDKSVVIAKGQMKAGLSAGDTFTYDKTAESAYVNNETEGIMLQIGDSSTSADRLNVSINSFHTDKLFSGLNGLTNKANDSDNNAAIASIKIESKTGGANSSSTYNSSVRIMINDKDSASAAADGIRQVSSYVSDERGKLGAQQNRLDHTVNNLTTASENVSAANSRIRDTDMAKEMMAYTSKNVIAQAAQSMLAQANSQPQNVLSLLQ